MLIIPVKDGENIDRALKRFKRKFDRTKTMKILRENKQFTKPSVNKRKQMQKAQYVQNIRTTEEKG
jgi:small subunit ribosomal protein S21